MARRVGIFLAGSSLQGPDIADQEDGSALVGLLLFLELALFLRRREPGVEEFVRLKAAAGDDDDVRIVSSGRGLRVEAAADGDALEDAGVDAGLLLELFQMGVQF